MEHPIRRKDIEATAQEAELMLEEGLYGTLATVDQDGEPYAVPLFYVYLEGAVYFHCAMEGHKLRNIADNNRVCFNAVPFAEVISDRFSAYYSSVTVFGTAAAASEEEKKRALVALIEKYSPDFYKEGMEYIDRMYQATYICKITPSRITAKIRKKQ